MDNSININVDQLLAEYGLTEVENVTPNRAAVGNINSEVMNNIVNSSDIANSDSNNDSNNDNSEHHPLEQLDEIVEDVNYEDVTENNPNPNEEEVDELLNSITVKDLSKHHIIDDNKVIIKENLARFSSAEWFEEIQKKTITLAGLGGIGSWIALILSRLNPESIYLFDDDRVEAVNMAGQFYQLEDIDFYKVDAVANSLKAYSNYYNVYSMRCKYELGSVASNIMICGFDNMEARKTFYRNWVFHVKNSKGVNPKECLYIDGRLTADEFQIFAIKGDDDYNMQRYEKEYLFDDKDAEETICSFKQTTYCATMIASYIVNIFVNFIASIKSPLLYDVPFKVYYGANMMFLKSEA